MNVISSPAALLILAITVVVSLLGLYRDPRLIGRLVLRPYYVARGRQPETVITSGFVHGDMAHLLFNMFTFFFFAFPMEQFLGTTEFVILYLAGLVLSSACSIWSHRDDPGYATLGASGAVSAVLFAFIVYFPLSTLLIFPIPFPVPAILFGVGYVAWSWWAGRQQRGNVNHGAHLCGALTGLGFVLVTDPGALLSLPSRI